jgi:hypothetical protein
VLYAKCIFLFRALGKDDFADRFFAECSMPSVFFYFVHSAKTTLPIGFFSKCFVPSVTLDKDFTECNRHSANRRTPVVPSILL